MNAFKRQYVYFEKQSNDRLCGVHCINSLLQGPFYDAISLSEIGLKLDELENQLMGKQTSSANVDDDGNFNIQVLSDALAKKGCEIKALKKREAIGLLEKDHKIEAFLFNSSTHWFAIRKIENIWFNLNSTNSNPGPEIISDFYLSAFIQGAEDIGYTNFLVTKMPPLPDLKSNIYSNRQTYQRFVDYNDILKERELKKKQDKERDKKTKDNIKKDDEEENEEERKKKEEEEKKFKPFQGKGITLDNSKKEEMYFEDDDIKQAYELSLIEFAHQTCLNLPPEPKEGGYNITVKVNDLSLSRKWNPTDKIKVNYNNITI